MGIVGFELCAAQYGANEGGEGKLSEYRGGMLLFGHGDLVFWHRVLLYVQCASLTFVQCPSLTFVIFITLFFSIQSINISKDEAFQYQINSMHYDRNLKALT
jgi:hypothetical protein